MSTIIKELKKVMTEFFDNIEANISKIHLANGVDNQTVTKEIADAITSNVTPMQTQIGELQKAMQDIVTALTNGDTAAAQATATAAVNAASTGSNDSGVAGSSAA